MKKLYRNLPDSPGVYLMKGAKGKILYIGKAANLMRRVSSYFLRPHLRQARLPDGQGFGGQAHDSRIQKLVSEIQKIDHQKTDTAIEALILEAGLIKKYQPPFNVREKDDTSFLYVEITKEKFPRVILVRGKEKPGGERFGPFTSASSIREALRIVRKIFPFSIHSPDKIPAGALPADLSAKDLLTAEAIGRRRACFEYEIGLCPGICIGAISEKEYKKNIRNIRLFFRGKKAQILRSLERGMKAASAALEFETAEKLKRQIFALRHIQDVALISNDLLPPTSYSLPPNLRIEGYDISNISGTSAVGSMVVFRGGKPDRTEYRKFKIRTITGSNDVGMLKEVLRRRFKHPAVRGGFGWALPDLVLIDGGRGQINAAKEVLSETGLKIPVVGIAKGPERKRNDVVGFPPKWADKKTLIHVRDEAHRFAIRYHKKIRAEKFLPG